MSKNHQAEIYKYFSKTGILYNPELAIALESPNAAIILGQLLYWHNKGAKKPWTYKTIEDMRRETGLTRTQQDTAIKKLKSLGIVSVRRMGVPATRYFRVNMEKLHETLPSLKKSCKLNYPNPSNYYVGNGGSITKITRKTTSKDVSKVDHANLNRKKQELAKSMSIRRF